MFMALINAVFGIVQNMSWDLAWAIDRNTWFNEYFKEMREVFLLEEDGLPFQAKTGAEKFQTLEFKEVSVDCSGTLVFHYCREVPSVKRWLQIRCWQS